MPADLAPIPAEPLHPSNAPGRVVAAALERYESAQHPHVGKLVAAIDSGYAAGLAVGRKQTAAEIRDAIWAAKPSVRQFWDTADAARVYALNDAAKIADRIAKGDPTP